MANPKKSMYQKELSDITAKLCKVWRQHNIAEITTSQGAAIRAIAIWMHNVRRHARAHGIATLLLHDVREEHDLLVAEQQKLLAERQKLVEHGLTLMAEVNRLGGVVEELTGEYNRLTGQNSALKNELEELKADHKDVCRDLAIRDAQVIQLAALWCVNL